ncbi:MAG: 2-hydroxyglutaryl-CoA dehydratase [Candidatus Syntrophonatronum acetioxidans]|uniref:2-hydroxyglutaryl-CoA dehydratase n=1 Tax=Candidatus Syntrophonatronum acetioxidans TaxID=1795816 RepID=A0A424YF35_9FIRM|nr:MAG: 2-hydroxyglutaryl-CoA dehydratase [Candidatus Syntrophonatronum acetioxidans]
MEGYLGLDVGSVSTNIVIIDEKGKILTDLYTRTQGQPIKVVQEGLREAGKRTGKGIEIKGVGTTGSARTLAGVMVGADTIKNEITAHAVAATQEVPRVQTVLEIGGQDSKIIILREGIVVDFAMNTVCAAGTGSFLDHQASRLDIPIEEFGKLALKSDNPVRIAGRCSVFAESDMIHKQQMGHSTGNIIAGLCEALVRNYLNNVGKGKEILPPVVFQGGVAANEGIRAAFEKALEQEIIVPKHHDVMGAIGAALLAKMAVKQKGATDFRGFSLSNVNYEATSFECKGCPNLCEIVNIAMEGKILARWGGRCGKWEQLKEAGSQDPAGAGKG